MIDQTEKDFILRLATSSASLDKSPKKNWVENAGGLPPYVRKLARAIAKNGHSLDSAIAIAISRVKAWAAGGGDVSAETRAKAVKALAQWEAARAKSHVKLSAEQGGDYLVLGATSFNTEIVRHAWDAAQGAIRKSNDLAPYRWIRELGTDYIIVETESPTGPDYSKIEYSVDSDDNVSFGYSETPIRQAWVEDTDELTLSEKRAIADTIVLSTPLERVARAAKGLK